jgi:hypothetical protein
MAITAGLNNQKDEEKKSRNKLMNICVVQSVTVGPLAKVCPSGMP